MRRDRQRVLRAVEDAAKAAWRRLREENFDPDALMLVVMMPDGGIRIADGGMSREAALTLLCEAPQAVEDYVGAAIAQHKKEAH